MKDVDVLILIGVAFCIGFFVVIYLPWIFIRGKAAKYDPYDKLPDEGVNGWLLLMLVQVFSITPLYSGFQLLALLKTVNDLRSQAFTNFAYAIVALRSPSLSWPGNTTCRSSQPALAEPC